MGTKTISKFDLLPFQRRYGQDSGIAGTKMFCNLVKDLFNLLQLERRGNVLLIGQHKHRHALDCIVRDDLFCYRLEDGKKNKGFSSSGAILFLSFF